MPRWARQTGLQTQHHLKTVGRLLELTGHGEGPSQSDMDVSDAGIRFQGLRVLLNGLIQPPLVDQNSSKIQPGCDLLRISCGANADSIRPLPPVAYSPGAGHTGGRARADRSG